MPMPSDSSTGPVSKPTFEPLEPRLLLDAATHVFDGADLALWQQNYAPLGYTGLTADVPEPATLALLTLGGLAVFARQKRRA